MFNDKEKPGKNKSSDIGDKKPVGSRISYKDRKKMEVVGRDPNYVYRWVNSDDAKYAGRVEEMKARGYTVCSEQELVDASGIEGATVGSVVGKPVGRGIRGVLMKQRKDYYEEDQQQKQAEVDRTEEGMMPEELLNSDSAVGDGLKINRPSQDIQRK